MSETKKGWILNLDRDGESKEILSTRAPALVLDDGTLVFEVWKWVRDHRRWFVLSMSSNPQLEAKGVVYYTPQDVPLGLREKLARVEMLERRKAG